MDFQIEKRLVQEFYKSIEMSNPQNIPSVLKKYCSETLIWRGFHPFNMIRGPEEVGKKFWQPLLKSLKKCQRREDIFFAGFNEIKGHEGVWVVSMGHLMGLFDESWLGIPASEKLTMLRYCEFNKIEEGKIIETAMFFDIPHLMSQTGIKPFVYQTAAHLVQPGPKTHDGLLFNNQDHEEGIRTLNIIESMVNDVKDWQNFDKKSLKKELKQSWNDDMIWWVLKELEQLIQLKDMFYNMLPPLGQALRIENSLDIFAVLLKEIMEDFLVGQIYPLSLQEDL